MAKEKTTKDSIVGDDWINDNIIPRMEYYTSLKIMLIESLDGVWKWASYNKLKIRMQRMSNDRVIG